MSDPMAGMPPEPMVATAAPDEALGLVDRNLQFVRQVEKSWGLPELPDAVKLDLAAQDGMEPSGLGAFLHGLSADMKKALNPLGRPAYAEGGGFAQGDMTPQAPGWKKLELDPALFDQDPNSPANQVRKIYTEIASLRAPSVVTTSATRDFVAKAKGKGLLPEGYASDPSVWTPELNQAYFQDLEDEFKNRLSGNRSGAVSIEQVAKTFDDWLSPSGLLRAATSMKFLPDAAEANRELEEWGDKWRKFTDTKAPKDLLDALTGPVDDLVVPLVNDFLLLTGVGSVFQFARGAKLGADAARASGVVYKSWAGTRAGSALSRVGLADEGLLVGDDVARLGQPSFMSRLAERSTIGAVRRGGEQMEAWRRLKSVQVTKKAVQGTMRLGLAGRVEGALLGDEYLDNNEPLRVRFTDTAAYAGFRSNSPGVGVMRSVLDLPFTPPNLLRVGSISTPLRGLGSKIRAQYAKIPETKYGGEVGNAITRTTEGQLKVLDEEIRRGDLVGDALEAKRAERAELVFHKERFQETLRREGPTKALAQWMGSSDDEAGLMVLWATAVAAVDNQGASFAGPSVEGLLSQPTQYLSKFHLARRKAIGQLRHIDPDDVETYAHTRAVIDTGPGAKRERLLKARRKYTNQVLRPLEGIGDADQAKARMQGWIRQANDMRVGFFNQLLETLPDGAVEESLAKVLSNETGFPGFVAAIDDIRSSVRRGLLDETRLAQPLSDQGRRMGGLWPKRVGGVNFDELEGGYDDTYKRWFNPLYKSLEPHIGSLTVARKDSVVKQDLLEYGAVVERRLDLLDAVKSVEAQPRVRKLLEETHSFASAQGTVSAKVLSEYVHELAANANLGPKSEEVVKRLVRYARANGVDVPGLRATLESDIAKLDQSSVWETFKVGRQDYTAVGGADLRDLRKRLKELDRVADFTAAEVEGPQELMDALSARGYRLVHGVDFLAPQDLMGLVKPLDTLGESQLSRLSLGISDDATYEAAAAADDVGEALGDLDVTHVDELAEALGTGVPTPSTAQKAALRLRKFVTRPDPEAVKDRYRQKLTDSVYAALKSAEPKLATPLDLSSPETEDTKLVLNHVRSILRAYQQAGTDNQVASRGYSLFGRFTSNLDNMKLPLRPSDLSQKQLEDGFGTPGDDRYVSGLKDMLGVAGTAAVHRGLKRAQGWGGFEYRGLAALEDHLRSRNQVVDFTHFLARTNAGQRLKQPGVANKARGALGEVTNPQRYLGAVAGATAGAAASDDSQATTIGAVAGALGGPAALRATGAVRGMQRAARAFEDSSWAHYGYLADGLASFRDTTRFKLSPFFDLSRYTEGMWLSTIADLPEEYRAKMPVLASLKRYGKDAAKNGWTPEDEVLQRFAASARGDFDYEALESTQRRFTDVGILGYNPTHYQAAAFGYLTAAGMPAPQAYERAKAIFTYGASRSPLELSVNFIFFPFSFQKKMVTDTVKFLDDDLSRAVFIHDALKSYEVLNEHYNLSEEWEEHLPILEELNRLNPFRFGLSPGELGGINRPLLDAALRTKTGSRVANTAAAPLAAFLPVGVHIRTAEDGKHIQQLVKRLMPVFNDIPRMLDNVAQQGHVAFGSSHVTRKAEIDKGYAEWSAFREQMDNDLADIGGYAGTLGRKEYAPLKEYVDSYKRDLGKKYPGWRWARGEAAVDAQARAAEIKERTIPQYDHETGEMILSPEGTPVFENTRDEDLATFSDFLEAEVNPYLSSLGIDLRDNPEDAEPEVFEYVREVAIALAARGNGFERDYRRYYQRLFGPIQSDLT